MTPEGRPAGVTVMRAGGEQEPAASEAVTVAGAPPESRVNSDGETSGRKSAAPTFTTKLVNPDGPRG
ncbi:MAG: hypothetical protein KJ062_12945, partial [Thermoanaerobaculia bacterium]|nr:hypothetical protein [Thermoanaerobaculia bacterium]